MSYIIGQLISLIKLLHSENGASQIAAGCTIGLLLGLSPLISIQGLVLVFLLACLRVQIGAALAMMAVTKTLALLSLPLLAFIGEYVLSAEIFTSTFTQMYNLPLLPYTKFNHSTVMGGLIISLILGPLIFLLFRLFVERYQQELLEKVKRTKIWKAMKASTLYQWYAKYESITK